MSAVSHAFSRLRPPGRDEAPRTLVEPPTRSLGLIDQAGLWGNLGVSLLGFTGAVVVLQPAGPGTPRLSILAALIAIVVGTGLGAAAVAVSALAGAQTGIPAMMLLRGLFGARLSFIPTLLNIVQMLGWGTFELVTIATAADEIVPEVPRWVFVIVGGVLTTVLAIRPLGAVRVLRRYVTIAVACALVYLFVQLIGHPMPSVTQGRWAGFGVGVDTTLAVAASWIPMAADYSRHSRSPRATAAGTFVGYALTQTACYALGVVALATVAADGDHIFAAFLAVPFGSLAFGVLAARELDQSFANVYSTTVSTQNLRPRWDRRVISSSIGVVVTVLALAVDIYGYASFLSLIGSIFVPMFAVLVADYFLCRGRRTWDVTGNAKSRWTMLVPWFVGFVVYQLVYPGTVGWWAGFWSYVGNSIGFSTRPWMSASLFSFVAAMVITCVLASPNVFRRRVRPR